MLIRELLTISAVDGPHRRESLIGLVYAYHAAGSLAARLGIPGMPTLAADRLRDVANELGDPVWIGVAAWSRAHFLSGANRLRQYELAVRVADEAPAEQPETRGMANLTAALASSARGDDDLAQTHLRETAALAELIEPDVSSWPTGLMNFGRTNVGIWRLSIAVELGWGARVDELAADIRPETIGVSRQAAFWLDYGRGLVAERKTRARGIAAIMRAEKLAPQQIRNNVWARETVAGLLAATRRDAGGRDLRGLAWRLGVAPTG